MTDNEIIEAMPFLAKYCKKEYNDIRVDEVLLGAYDLINRQKANAEGLTNAVKFLNEQLSSTRAEAVKEFAELVKIKTLAMVHSPKILTSADYIKCIDDTLKEWAGEG